MTIKIVFKKEATEGVDDDWTTATREEGIEDIVRDIVDK